LLSVSAAGLLARIGLVLVACQIAVFRGVY
jgi:hypothetical protein